MKRRAAIYATVIVNRLLDKTHQPWNIYRGTNVRNSSHIQQLTQRNVNFMQISFTFLKHFCARAHPASDHLSYSTNNMGTEWGGFSSFFLKFSRFFQTLLFRWSTHGRAALTYACTLTVRNLSIFSFFFQSAACRSDLYGYSASIPTVVGMHRTDTAK